MSLSIVNNYIRPIGKQLFKIESLLAAREARIDQIARQEFENHFIYQKFCSASLNFVAISLSAGALCCIVAGSVMSSVSLAVVAIFVAIIGYQRESDPNQLMRKAFKEIDNGNERQALELIKRGANLDLCSTVTIWDFFPQLLDLIRDVVKGNIMMPRPPVHSPNVFDQAGYKEKKEILRYLASIGFDFQHAYILQTACSLEMVKYLVDELGMPVNVGGQSRRLSPLYLQIAAIRVDARNGQPIEWIKERIRIVQYLLNKGASSKDEEDIDNQLIEQILDVKSNEQEKELVQQIIKQYKQA